MCVYINIHIYFCTLHMYICTHIHLCTITKLLILQDYSHISRASPSTQIQGIKAKTVFTIPGTETSPKPHVGLLWTLGVHAEPD